MHGAGRSRRSATAAAACITEHLLPGPVGRGPAAVRARSWPPPWCWRCRWTSARSRSAPGRRTTRPRTSRCRCGPARCRSCEVVRRRRCRPLTSRPADPVPTTSAWKRWTAVTYRVAVVVVGHAARRAGRRRSARRCPARPTPTSSSSAPATPGCGRRTTWPRPTRPCGSSCSRRRPRGSARPAATAAGARRCSRRPGPRWPAGRRARRRHPAAAGHVRHRRRGRPGGRRRGHGRPLGQGRHRRAGPHAAAGAAGRAPRSTRPGPGGSASEDYAWLTAAEAASGRARPTSWAATFTPHCAAIHPARLVRGLAAAVERRGVRLYEGSPALAVEPGVVRTPHGDVRAPHVIRATEGYTPSLPGHQRDRGAGLLAHARHRAAAGRRVGPRSGWRARETFNDYRHLIIYGQRTADDRLAFGGRGAPYHFGSSDRAASSTATRPCSPSCGGCWSSCSPWWPTTPSRTRGAARSGCPATGTPRSAWTGRTGLGWAGGYVGDGVGTANLAGRTLADLVLDRRDSDLLRLPWVEPPLPPVGAGAAALPRRQHRAARHDRRGPRRGAHRTAGQAGPGARPVPRPLTRRDAVRTRQDAAHHRAASSSATVVSVSSRTSSTSSPG